MVRMAIESRVREMPVSRSSHQRCHGCGDFFTPFCCRSSEPRDIHGISDESSGLGSDAVKIKSQGWSGDNHEEVVVREELGSMCVQGKTSTWKLTVRSS